MFSAVIPAAVLPFTCTAPHDTIPTYQRNLRNKNMTHKKNNHHAPGGLLRKELGLLRLRY